MTLPRRQLIAAEATPYYHCVSRCVRRAFLCGNDSFSGRCFDHRKQWIEDRLLFLAQVFAMDLCAYAVMSNHVHVVLHIALARANRWSDLEVCVRWHRLFNGTSLSQKLVRGEQLQEFELPVLARSVQEWRSRLASISWFMKCVNEPLARLANEEDGCTGKFWESRFKSQALLDEKALAACLAYVDLNPVRAGIAETPEASEHTSIRRRIQQLRTQENDLLLPFVGNPREPMPEGLPFRFEDYLELVDYTGRVLRDDKRGHIDPHLPGILERLDFSPREWAHLTRHFERRFKHFVGGVLALEKAVVAFGLKRRTGLRWCREAFG
jgi:REP element-mobilizing transposase RayT